MAVIATLWRKPCSTRGNSLSVLDTSLWKDYESKKASSKQIWAFNLSNSQNTFSVLARKVLSFVGEMKEIVNYMGAAEVGSLVKLLPVPIKSLSMKHFRWSTISEAGTRLMWDTIASEKLWLKNEELLPLRQRLGGEEWSEKTFESTKLKVRFSQIRARRSKADDGSSENSYPKASKKRDIPSCGAIKHELIGFEGALDVVYRIGGGEATLLAMLIAAICVECRTTPVDQEDSFIRHALIW